MPKHAKLFISFFAVVAIVLYAAFAPAAVPLDDGAEHSEEDEHLPATRVQPKFVPDASQSRELDRDAAPPVMAAQAHSRLWESFTVTPTELEGDELETCRKKQRCDAVRAGGGCVTLFRLLPSLLPLP